MPKEITRKEDNMYRQGELIIREVKKVEGKKLQYLILAEGEATGHKHEVIGEAELYEKDGVLYLSAKEQVEVIHPDHKTLELPKGNYEVITQREYVVGDEKYRKVID